MLSESAHTMAQQELEGVIKQSLTDLEQRRHYETARLAQLKQRNPLISDTDVSAQAEYFDLIEQAISEHCKLEMSAVRVLVTYRPEKG